MRDYIVTTMAVILYVCITIRMLSFIIFVMIVSYVCLLFVSHLLAYDVPMVPES